jgi:hypothetical protein
MAGHSSSVMQGVRWSGSRVLWGYPSLSCLPTPREVAERGRARGWGGVKRPSRTPATHHTPQPEGCTLASYADAKRLPRSFLEGIGLSEVSYASRPAVRMPYRRPDGTDAAANSA